MKVKHLFVLLCMCFYVLFVLWKIAFPKNISNISLLRVSILDVGQGDAILIQAPNGKQILVDGGPEDIVMSELKKVMPRGDISIDMLVITNPDADHIAGFSSVLDTYSVASVLEPGTRSQTPTYKDLIKKIKSQDIHILTAYKGMKIVIDKEQGISLEVLFPDQKVRGWSSNDGSIVMKLVYGETSMMLMGDATELTEKILAVTTDKEKLQSDILKVGHHGSKTSTSELWLEAVEPNIAAISVGVSNRYGHPTDEVLERLNEKEIEVFRTDEEGTIVFESDGVEFKKIENF